MTENKSAIYNVVALLIESHPEYCNTNFIDDEIEELQKSLSEALQYRLGKSFLPKINQSVAVTITKQKTAALFYDRIWSMPLLLEQPPKELTVYGATEHEILSQLIILIDNCLFRSKCTRSFAQSVPPFFNL